MYVMRLGPSISLPNAPSYALCTDPIAPKDSDAEYISPTSTSCFDVMHISLRWHLIRNRPTERYVSCHKPIGTANSMVL